MRYFRIFAAYSQHVIEGRGRVFVWLLTSLIQPIIFLVFWQGTVGKNAISTTGWTGAEITTYYLLFFILAGLLTAHVEEDVSKRDIYEGELVNYLTRPFPYFWQKLFKETPYRLLQGVFGIPLFLIGAFFLRDNIQIHMTFTIFCLSLIIAILAYLLSFVFKMIIGLMAIWTLEISGYYQIIEIALLVFAGYIIPITFLPDTLSSIAQVLPFAYMMYYPVVSFVGKLSIQESLIVICIQIIWLLVFAGFYKLMLRQGIKSFTGIG